MEITELKGQILTEILNIDDRELIFTTKAGKQYRMFHDQDCCESVFIHTIAGDLNSLLNSKITKAEIDSSDQRPKETGKPEKGGYVEESETWTTFTLAVKGMKVKICWHGSSNGYYSESVDFREIN